MALTEIPIELSSTPGIVDNSNATAITIDASENVGIGNSSGVGKLEVYANNTAPAAYIRQDGTGPIQSWHVAGGTERMRILSTGGITFNGDTAQANALDDYEEGAWTPAFIGYSGATGWSFSDAKYTKIGNVVYLTCAISGGSGSLGSVQNQSRLSGIPFNVSGAQSPCSWVTNYITDEGNGIIYTNVVYSPTFTVTNEKTIYFSGVYHTA